MLTIFAAKSREASMLPQLLLSTMEPKSGNISPTAFKHFMSSPVRLSVCLSSVSLVHPTQAIEIFGNVSMPFGTLAIYWHKVKFYGDRPRGTPPSRELSTKGLAEYSDFGRIERYISVNGAR